MNTGQFNQNGRNPIECIGDSLTPRERELFRYFKSQQPLLICPDDVGIIRATMGQTLQAFAGIGGLAPAGTSVVTLPPLGLKYCLDLGLESSSGLVAADNYSITVARNGTVVATYTRAQLLASTANERAAMCPGCVCAGELSTLVLTLTNTGTAAYAAGATFSTLLCRDFNVDAAGMPIPRSAAGSCSTGC